MSEVKKIEIEVPSDFDTNSAQDCFNLGLRVLSGVYQGGTFLAYTTEETKEQGIMNILFKNESAAAIIQMSKILTNIENNVAGNKVDAINEAGKNFLNQYFNNK